nr:CAZy families PL1 protein [uncultured Bacteroides sp.]
MKNVGANIPCRDIVDERIIKEVETGQAYYEKKLPKDSVWRRHRAFAEITG